MNILQISKSSSAKTEFSGFFRYFFVGFRFFSFFQYRRRCRFFKISRYRFRFSVTDSALGYTATARFHQSIAGHIYTLVPRRSLSNAVSAMSMFTAKGGGWAHTCITLLLLLLWFAICVQINVFKYLSNLGQENSEKCSLRRRWAVVFRFLRYVFLRCQRHLGNSEGVVSCCVIFWKM